MNSLVITFNADTPLELPMSYNHQVQGALYALWREEFPDLHDEGYSDGRRDFRMFTFGPLKGRFKAENKRISFTGPVSFEVRSPNPELVETLCDGFQASGQIRLGRSVMPLLNLECRDRLLFPDTAVVSTIAPITVYSTLPDGHTLYRSPTEREFEQGVIANLKSKLDAAGLDLDTRIMLRPYPDTVRKVVSAFKTTIINAYHTKLRLYAHPETMAFLYYAGIGSKSSQGYGMVRIEDEG